MNAPKISLLRLRQLVKEERALALEAVDHKGINSIVAVASKLLAAVEGFKDKAPPSAIHAVTPHVSALERVLEDMLASPGSYIPQPKKVQQVVSLKANKKA